jgi:hypothetical protein
MEMESLSFTAADYDEVVGDYFERERSHLIERLRRVVEETETAAPRLEGRAQSSDGSWNGLETLAHMAITAQFFGSLIPMIAAGKEVGDPIEVMKLRDPAIADAVALPPEVLAKQLRENVEKTIEFLETVPYDDFRKRITFGSRQLMAEDFTRISLCHHLEDHLEQMREAIGH